MNVIKDIIMKLNFKSYMIPPKGGGQSFSLNEIGKTDVDDLIQILNFMTSASWTFAV